MKKKFLLILSVAFYSNFIYSQQIANASFENWSTVGSTLELDGWLSVNAMTDNYPTYGVLRTTDAYDGTYALQLKSGRFDLTPGGFPMVDTGALVILGVPSTFGPPPGIPFTGRPEKLSFYYKYTPGTTPIGAVDTARVYLRFKNAGSTVGEGEYKIYGSAVSTYTYHEIVINWNGSDSPDSLMMDLTSGLVSINYSESEEPCNNQYGNTLIIDKMVFSYPLGINEDSAESRFKLFPNPANDMVKLNVDSPQNGLSSYTITIYDITGAIVMTQDTNSNNPDISTADLCNGQYIIQVRSEGFIAQQKIIILH